MQNTNYLCLHFGLSKSQGFIVRKVNLRQTELIKAKGSWLKLPNALVDMLEKVAVLPYWPLHVAVWTVQEVIVVARCRCCSCDQRLLVKTLIFSL